MLKRLLPYLLMFLLLQTLLRLSLLARSVMEVGLNLSESVQMLALGMWFDAATVGFVLLPVVIYHLCLPARLHGSTIDRRVDAGLRGVYAFALLFDVIAEHLFWSEFTTRFNFIAVDYLVYTQEVIGNIVESYPLFWLLSGIAVCAGILAWGSVRAQPLAVVFSGFRQRMVSFAGMLLACAGMYAASDLEQDNFKDNVEMSEIAANGVYNLFHAFFNNEIRYDRFYMTQPDEVVAKHARALLQQNDASAAFVSAEGKDLTRMIHAIGKEQHKNVMLVVMESLSASYMQTFGQQQNITPNLDRLAKEGLLFANTYATGTRTVRGLEAVTLSIPPTPGQSILRRPGNDNLFSLGFLLKDRGYDTKFIYGGYGYFDNMNNFFSANGFDILDRTSMTKEEVNFANIWGICDEDMFTRAIKEADASYAQKKPFLHLIMTTSNHRPYSYPEGRIDIPSHSNRVGGVKYADYSVGKLIEDAKNKAWFKNTIFVFVADHTAGAGGKAELDSRKYHIPMIFYAPGMIVPQRIDRLVSQIDVAPTLLGMMHISTPSKFYGVDVLNHPEAPPHAFISNFQKVALVKNDTLTVLAPKRKIEHYSWPDMQLQEGSNDVLVDDAVAYYQSASWWQEQYKRIPTVVKP